MEESRVFDEDSSEDIARKIFKHFAVHQSCTISGFSRVNNETRLTPKGEVVLDYLRKMDAKANTQVPPDGRPRRKRRILPNSIGGYIAQKIFTWKWETRDGMPYCTIWRYQ